MGRPPAALVATLGTQPGVVTIALDLLLDRDEPIDEIVVVHTSSPRLAQAQSSNPPPDLMARALAALEREFPGRSEYHHRRIPCRYRPVCLQVDGRAIDDVRNEYEARCVFTTLFQEVRDLKQRRYAIHLSIAGGRKSMSVYGMATAQLLFDSRDRLWHVFSEAEFEKQSLMHPRGPEDARLVRIPVLPVSTVFPGMVTLMTAPDPLDVLERKEAMMVMEGRRNREEFLIKRLTPAEKSLVDSLMESLTIDNRSLSNSELARKLVITSRVVANRFTGIYNKLREYMGLQTEEIVDRTTLVSFLTPYYTERY